MDEMTNYDLSKQEALVSSFIRSLLKTNYLDRDLNLITAGLDSIKTVKLIVELEVMFDIIIEDDELNVNNFSTIQKILDIINFKLSPKAI
jgi:acyl carrier protein